MYRTVLGWLIVAALPAVAQASGQPDPTFGGDGIVTFGVEDQQFPMVERPYDLLIDREGRYVTVGSLRRVGGDQVAALVTRHLANGSPDIPLGGEGFVALEWQGKSLLFQRVRELSDGKLLLAGITLTPLALPDAPVVCRLTDGGQFDHEFGTAGCRALNIVNAAPGLRSELLIDMEIQADGRIVVLGKPVENPDDPRGFAIVSLLPDGADDLSFGNSIDCPAPAPRCGLTYSAEPMSDAIVPGGFALDQEQGRMVVGGYMNLGSFQLITAFRYDAQGDLDLAFEAQNFDSLTGDPDTSHLLKGVHVMPDSSVLLTGEVNFGSKNRVVVAKLRADGTHDDPFGDAGRAIYAFDPLDAYSTLSQTKGFLQSDGKLLLAGESGAGAARRCRVLRVDSATAALDTGFGQQGVVSPKALDDLASGACNAHGIVSDNKHVLMAGVAHLTPNDPSTFLLRLDREGLFDDSFEE